MSGREYRDEHKVQVRQLVEYVFDLVGNGAAAPQFAQGDTHGASTGSYMTIARTGVGVYTITTNDPFLSVVSTGFAPANMAANANIFETSLPTQNANNTWTFTISVFVGVTATELTAAMHCRSYLALRNGAGT